MKFFNSDAYAPTAPMGNGVPLSRGGRFAILGIMAAICFTLGAMMEVTMLVMVLGLFNVSVVAFLLLKKDITWGFIFYITTSIFFQFGFWIRLPGFPDLYPARIASMLLYLVFMIQIMLGMRYVPPITRIERSMIIFMSVLFISIVTTGQRPYWLLLLNGYVYPFLFFYFARAVITKDSQVKLVFGYFVFVGLYCGVMGVFEKMGWYSLVFPKFIVDPSIRDHGLTRLGSRVRGIFLMPAVLGAVMVMGFFPAWLFLQRMKGMGARIAQLVLLLVTPPTIFFTNTRSVYLGFLSALLIGALGSRKLRPLCIGILLAGALGVFANWENMTTEDRDKGGVGDLNTVAYRINLLYETVEIFMDYPLFGCGFRNFTEIAKDYRRPRDVPFFGHIEIGVNADSVSHNAFLTVLAEQGVLGILPYILIFVFIFQTSLKAYRILPRDGLISKDYVVCIWMSMACYLSNAMFIEIRQFEYINVLLFFLMGVLVGRYDLLVDRIRQAKRAEDDWREETPSSSPRLGWSPGR